MPEVIQYPEVIIGGKKYSIRFGMNAIFKLNSWGIRVDSLASVMQEYQQSGRNIEMIVTLAAAALGRMVGGRWKSATFESGQDLADQMLNGEMADLIPKTMDALGKASPAGTNSAPTLPETTMEQPLKAN